MPSPSLVAAIPLLAGVVVGAWALLPIATLLCLLGIGWCAAALSLARRWPRPFAASCLCGCFAAGGALGARAAHDRSHVPLLDWFASRHALSQPVTIRGVLREDAATAGSGVTMTLDAAAILDDGREQTTRGGVRVSVAGSLAKSAAASWRQGRTIVIDASLREPTEYRNIGLPDDRDGLARQGIVLFASVKSASLVSPAARGSPIAELAGALRARVRAATEDAIGRWSAKSGGVVTAILIGDRSGLDPEDERRLQEAGTYHVIAISGGNIALLTTLLVLLGRAARLSPRPTAAASIGVLTFYGYAAGLAPSVMRATLAAVVYLTARVIDHRGTPMNALGVAASVAASVDPLSVLDPGFVLSFGATTGIVIAATSLVSRAPRDPTAARLTSLRRSAMRALRLLGAATLCAEIALAPIGARLFGRISLAGLLLNFVAIPLMSAIQVAGLTAVVVHLFSAPAAAVSGWIAHVGTVLLLRSATFVDLAPWLVLDVPPPAAWTMGVWYGGWGALFFCWRRPRMRTAASVSIVMAAVAIVWGPPAIRAYRVTPPPAGWTRVAFLDVGQGDATLLMPPDADPVLIDAGGIPGSAFDLGRRVVLPSLWALGVTRLGAVVLTHGDPDHIGGAPAVLRALSSREVWEGIPVAGHPALREVRIAATRQRVPWRHVRSGDRAAVGAAGIRVLHPPDPDWERQRVRNDDSIVLEVRIGRVVFILPADIGQAVEPAVVSLLDPLAPASLTIVKAPHHGSAGSSSRAFIDATRPTLAIFSAGRRNPFGHPAPVVLDRYRAAGSQIFRTDQDGEVIVDTNGEDVVVWTWSGRREVLKVPPGPLSGQRLTAGHKDH